MSVFTEHDSEVPATKSAARCLIASTSTVDVPTVKYKEMAGDSTGESSEKIRARVEEARRIQRDRLGRVNARMSPKEMKQFCRLDEECQELLKMAMTELNLSAAPTTAS